MTKCGTHCSVDLYSVTLAQNEVVNHWSGDHLALNIALLDILVRLNPLLIYQNRVIGSDDETSRQTEKFGIGSMDLDCSKNGT